MAKSLEGVLVKRAHTQEKFTEEQVKVLTREAFKLGAEGFNEAYFLKWLNNQFNACYNITETGKG